MRQINNIIIHGSDTYANMNIDIATVRKWHVERGWDDVGYHYFIRRNGKVERGREDKTVGAHVRGNNSDSIGICLAGGRGMDGSPDVNYTSAQWSTLAQLVLNLKFKYNIETIKGHRDYTDKKTCPGFDVIEWAKELGEEDVSNFRRNKFHPR